MVGAIIATFKDKNRFLINVDDFVSKGGRVYYENRSQPPMLTPMVDLYIKATNDLNFLRDKITLLEKEMLFWLQNRVTTVRGSRIARYNVEYDGPRPESYRYSIFNRENFKYSHLNAYLRFF